MKTSTYKITFHTEFCGTRSNPIVTYMNGFYPADVCAKLHKSPIWCNVPKSVLIIDEVLLVK